MGNLKILKRLSNKIKNKKKIFAFDVETQQKTLISEGGLQHIKQDFLMGSVVSDDMQQTFWDKKEMQDFLMSTETRNCLIFATNLDFDFKILFDNYNLKDFSFVERGGSCIIVTRKEEYQNKSNVWKFLDTLNYSKSSVMNLGKMFGFNKLDHPKCLGHVPNDYKEKRELEIYNMTDSMITFRFAKFMQDFCNKMKCKLKPTIASIGIDYWRRNHLKQDIFQERRHIIEKHYEGSMKGGRTEVFKRGLFKDVYYYDFNSMYPAVCKEGVSNGKYPLPSSVRTLNDSCYDYIHTYEGISKVKLKSPDKYVPLLGMHDKNGKLFFPKGDIEGWWTHVELRKAHELGYEFNDVSKTVYYDKEFVPFKDCVQRLYDLRSSYKREGNEPMEKIIKTLMNGGLFGKFAQKINNKTECYHIKNFYVNKQGEAYIMIDGKKIVLYNFNIRGDYIYENIEIPAKIPIFIMPILASYTTALARNKLFKYLDKYNDDLIYCDTDSLTLKKNIFENSTQLGKLKLEYNLKEAIFVRPKQYYCITNDNEEFIKMKGVIRTCVKTKEDFFKDEFNYQRFTKTKESAIRKIPYGSIITVNKHVNLEDDKRIWDGMFSYDTDQDSNPLCMIEGYSQLEYEQLRLKIKLKYDKEQEKLLEKDSLLYEERFGDTFDSMGDDITKEEFLKNETDWRDFE